MTSPFRDLDTTLRLRDVNKIIASIDSVNKDASKATKSELSIPDGYVPISITDVRMNVCRTVEGSVREIERIS